MDSTEGQLPLREIAPGTDGTRPAHPANTEGAEHLELAEQAEQALQSPAQHVEPSLLPERPAEIWAVGGGKGGTGKSFITSSLGCCLARRGRRVILLDGDLGGANLHSFLGLRRPKRTLTEFFESRARLDDLIVDTGVPGLRLVTGDLQSLDMDDVRYTQKQRLFRHVRALPADIVLIDLGAGSHVNTMDSFILADRMIVVTVPEVTAIENLYQFINSVFYRKLKVSFARRGMKELVVDTWRRRASHGIRSLRDLVEHFRATMPAAEEVIREELDRFTVHIILNQARTVDDAQVGGSVRSVILKYLGFRAEYAGAVRSDDNVMRCLNAGNPFVLEYPGSWSTREIEAALERIMRSALPVEASR